MACRRKHSQCQCPWCHRTFEITTCRCRVTAVQAPCTPPTKHGQRAVDLSDYEDKKQGINVWERSDVENVGTKLEEVKSPAYYVSISEVSDSLLLSRSPARRGWRLQYGCTWKTDGGGEEKQGSVCVCGGGGGGSGGGGNQGWAEYEGREAREGVGEGGGVRGGERGRRPEMEGRKFIADLNAATQECCHMNLNRYAGRFLRSPITVEAARRRKGNDLQGRTLWPAGQDGRSQRENRKPVDTAGSGASHYGPDRTPSSRNTLVIVSCQTIPLSHPTPTLSPHPPRIFLR